MPKPFEGFNHGTDAIDLSDYINCVEMRPVEIHLKENGAIGDKPSIAIVMTDNQRFVVGQLSLDMFNKGLADIGYRIEKIKP